MNGFFSTPSADLQRMPGAEVDGLLAFYGLDAAGAVVERRTTLARVIGNQTV